MLVELSVVEQRYHSVMEVLAGAPVTEVAERYGVSRKQVYVWLARYQAEGLPGLADRSHRPKAHPWRLAGPVEARLVALRIEHPRWGPRRLGYELARAGVDPVPSRSTIYRALVRRGLVVPRSRRRRRQDYVRWERPGPMQLWQMDVTGSVRMVDGSEAKLISGIDDHSRFCVIATVVTRATGRAVCAAFAGALTEFGVPEQVLTDNGRQFTGKYGRPRPTEVLFDRICRENGIEHLLTKVRSPTTTGKVERWHQTLQRELLDVHPPFVDVAEAQAAVDAWRVEYNTGRPHQALDMATPADRFTALPGPDRARLELWLPPTLTTIDEADAAPVVVLPVEQEEPAWSAAGAVELERAVPPCGNVAVGGQQLWFGPHRAGEIITFWIDSTTVHLSSTGTYLKSVPSRLSDRDVSRLARAGARPAGPPPARRLPGRMLDGIAIEVDRTVTPLGAVSLGNRPLPVGIALAGQRVTIRLEHDLAHVQLSDGTIWRTSAFSLPAATRRRLQGARPAEPNVPLLAPWPVRVERLVSCRGSIQVLNQRVQVGLPHARKTVTVVVEDTVLRILDEDQRTIKDVPRTGDQEVKRIKAYGHRSAEPARDRTIRPVRDDRPMTGTVEDR
ncbi:transposase InsO family protein [Cellulomonas sp. URHB0016]